MTGRRVLLAAWLALAGVSPVEAPPAPGELIAYRAASEKWGYADHTGRVVIPAVYDTVTPFRDGIAEVRQDRRWGFIDPRGQVVIPLRWSYTTGFSDGLAGVGLDTGRPTGIEEYGPRPGQRQPVTAAKYGFIDRSGAIVIPLEYDWVRPFKDGVAQVSRTFASPRCRAAGHWGLVDTRGTVVVPVRHCHVGEPIDGLVRVVHESSGPGHARVGFVDRQGREVIPVLPYDWVAERWFEDRLAVRRGDRWGFVDRTGREVIAPTFEDVHVFRDGRARVRVGGKWGFVDPAGALVIPAR